MGQFGNDLKKGLFKKKDVNTKFKDNRERFRFFNRFYKQPKAITFVFISIIGLILAIFPFPFPSFISTFDGWMLWGFGLGTAILFEAIANFHYYKYSKVAKDKSFTEVKWNVITNVALRYVAMAGLLLLALALAVMTFSPDGSGTFASIW